MDEVNYGEELAKARSVALSGRANEIESELLGPYTRHLLTEIAHTRHGLVFKDFQIEDYPGWWSDQDKSTFANALHALNINRQLSGRICVDDDRLSWIDLTWAYRDDRKWLEKARHYPRCGDMGDYGYHLVREAAFFNRSNRLNTFGRDNLPAWWTQKEVELFYSLVKGASPFLSHGESN